SGRGGGDARRAARRVGRSGRVHSRRPHCRPDGPSSGPGLLAGRGGGPMSVAVEDPPLVLGTGHGGMPARRAVVRWAWRLFRREWRQQLLVLALLVAAVAAATLGEAFGSSASGTLDGTFGTANYLVRMPGTSPAIAQNIDAAR